MKRPPRLAEALLRRLLPDELFEPIAGDLEEDWHAAAARGARGRRWRYWRLALASLAACARARRDEPRRPAARRRKKGDGLVSTLWQDLTFGLRLLRRRPGFTAAAVATLALGIGANSAIFSVLDVLVLRPIGYRDPERVAFVLGFDTERGALRFNLAAADYLDLREQAGSFQDLAFYSYWSANLTGGDLPERVQAYRVTANTFALLGVAPQLGRGFTPEEGLPGGADVVVLSDGLWRRRFGADPGILRRPVLLDGRAHAVVGVMPASFEYPVFNFKGDLWAPYRLDAAAVRAERGSSSGVVVGRLKPQVAYPAARAEVQGLMRRLEAEHPRTNRSIGARVVEMQRLDEEYAGASVALVPASAAILLLLACANVANLLPARGLGRQRELAVRTALGAGRARLVRQLLAESALLGLGGGALGAALAFPALAAIRAALPDVMIATQPGINELGVNRATLGFTLAVSLAASLLVGLVPALRAARPGLEDALKEGAAAGGSRRHRRLRAGLVVAQVAMSSLLLVTAGLLVRTFQGLGHAGTGFEPKGVLTLAVSLPEYRYPQAADRRRFYGEALAKLRALPGVGSADFVNVLPFSTYDRSVSFLVEGQARPEGRLPSAGYRVISPGYFETLRIPLRAGRPFEETDGPDAASVAIVNESLARRFFPGRDPLGARLRLGDSADAPAVTIVGLAGDVRHAQIDEPSRPELYVPLAQTPIPMMMLAARTSGRPEDLLASARAAILAVDPAQPVFHLKTLETLVEESFASRSSAMGLVLVFGGVALALAGVGLYGLASYAVQQQTREIGVRVALGARPRDVLRGVVLRVERLALLGAGLGLLAALGTSRLLSGLLFGVSPSDPLTFATVAAVILAVGVLAAAAPAWQALRIDPLVALRTE